MKRPYHLIFAALLLPLLTIQCKKNGNGSKPQAAPPFHQDITIHEVINSDQPPQFCIGLFQLSSAPTQLVFAATRGIGELYAQGFRMVGLTKDSTVNWIKSYALPSGSYASQYADCSSIDQQDNIWIGGHIFEGAISYGKPFLVKLDKSGNLLWSKALADSAHTSRGIAIKVLHNGDIAYLTFDVYSFQLFRLSADGSVLWSKIVSSSDSLQFEPSTNLFLDIFYNSHMLAETSDGSIFFGCNSNFPVVGKDCLIKFSSSGDLVFAKTYTWPGHGSAFPPQIIATETDNIIYADQTNTGINGATSYPYLFIASKDGDILASKAYPLNQQNNGIRLNELNYFQHKIYLSTAEPYEFNNYIFDQSLNLLSGAKTLGTNTISTQYGGMSLFDSVTSSLYHVLNLAGQPTNDNGFQYMKTDAKGTSCHPYNDPPISLLMNAVSVTVATVTPPISNGTKLFTENVPWAATPVSITSSETQCSQ